MPKNKSHRATAKRVKARKNDYKIGMPGLKHNTGKKTAAANRKKRKGSVLSKADINRLS